MKGYAYYNGHIGTCDEISVPLTDRVIYFGDAVYEVMVGQRGKIFLAEEHLQRLKSNLDFLHIDAHTDMEQINSLLVEMIKISQYESYSIYISISRDCQERAHSYKQSKSSNILIIITEFSAFSDKALSLITAEDRRYGYCNIKTVNLLPSVMAATKADKQNCDEAIFHRGEIVTECAHSNIFILKDGRLFTHPKSCRILPGITRNLLINTALSLGTRTIEKEFTLQELFSADEVIITSTTKFIKRAKTINGQNVGMQDEKLFSKFDAAIKEQYMKI